MTLIGAFNCLDGAVIFADRQVTIQDYAEWEGDKIKYFEFSGVTRVLMTGTGSTDTIDALWESFVIAIRENLFVDVHKIRELIVNVVSEFYKKSIAPVPRDDRPQMKLIWAIQQIQPISMDSPIVFKTDQLINTTIGRYYFTGSPVLLTQYLSDQFLKGALIGLDEAKALAVFLLWEAQAYDPYVGKNVDVLTLKKDGSISRLDIPEIKYWEEHFSHLKKAFKLLPLLSCATALTQQIYKPEDHLARFKTVMETLSLEQQKMRQSTEPQRSDLEKKLTDNLRKTAALYNS